jgi:hypothetical protein
VSVRSFVYFQTTKGKNRRMRSPCVCVRTCERARARVCDFATFKPRCRSDKACFEYSIVGEHHVFWLTKIDVSLMDTGNYEVVATLLVVWL